MEKEKFNQAKYMREWQKENMKQVKASYKTEFVDEFKEACKKLGKCDLKGIADFYKRRNGRDCIVIIPCRNGGRLQLGVSR